MTITVPKAGTNAGRAPEIRVRTPQTGAMIANLGQTGFNVTARLQEERDQREFQRAKIDLTRDLNNLRLEAMQIGDPDQLDAFWTARTTELRNSYLNGDGPDGAPRVNERIRPDFELAYDSLANSLAFDVGRDALAARMSQREANWLAYSQEITAGAGTSGPEARAVMIDQGAAMIDGMVAEGTITPEEGQRRKMELAAAADNAAAMQAIAIDPQGFLTDLDAGIYANLDAETQSRYRVQAGAALERIAAEEARAAEQAANAAAKERDATIREMISVMGQGRVPANIGMLDDPAAKDSPLYAEAMASYQLLREQPRLAEMSLDELDTLIAAEEERPITYAYQAERLKVLEEQRARMAKGYTTDPIGFAREQGFPVPDLPDFDPNDPKPYMRALLARQAMAETLMDKGLIDTPTLFEAGEADAYASTYGPGGDPEARLKWLMAMSATLGPDAPAAAGKATGDPVTGYAASLLAQGAQPGVVRDILAGQRRMADKTVVMPSRNEFVTAYSDATGQEFRNQFDLTPDLLDSAIALYAEAGGDGDTIDTDLFGTSVQRALGATLDDKGRPVSGGLAEFDTIGTSGGLTGAADNYNVPLPIGVAQRDVEAALTTIMDDLSVRWKRDPDGTGGVDGPPMTGSYTTPSLDRLTAISLSGAAPDFGAPGDAELYADLFGKLRIMAYWPNGKPSDTYVFYRPMADGSPAFLYDTEGKPFQFRLADLVREAAR